MRYFSFIRSSRWSGLLAGLACMLFCVTACGPSFDISQYSVKVLESYPGTMSDGIVIVYPSIAVQVSGPSEREWRITVGAQGLPGTDALTVTGRRVAFSVWGLSPERPEAFATVVITDRESGEVLASRRRVRLYLDDISEQGGGGGPEDPPVETSSLDFSSLSLLTDGDSMSLPVVDGKTAFEIQKGCSGSLVVSYSSSSDDDSRVSLHIQSEGSTHLRIPDGTLTRSRSSFSVPFTALSEGSGRIGIVLTEDSMSASLTVDYTVLPDGRVIELVPDVFTFAEQNDAMGSILFMGFNEGERCDVVLRWRERDSGEEGRMEYRGVDTGSPLRVLLWEADMAASWNEVSCWAELYVSGQGEPLYVTPVTKVYPFRPELLWWESDGKAVREGEVVRSASTGSACRLGVTVGLSRQEAVTRITVRDLRQGRSFVSTSAEPETEGCFVTDMVHPSKGRHDFVATFETAEGTYSYSFSQSFCDVWTVLPFVDGHSLYAELRGPERTVGERCELRISVDIYAVFDYTVAVERNGEKINEPARWWHFVERRGLDYTIEKGTAQGELKIQSGWVNTSVRHIKSVAEGLDWGVTGGTATRWVSSRTVQYKPQASKAGILLTLGVNESFRMAGNDVVLDLSRIQGTLDERGIVY